MGERAGLPGAVPAALRRFEFTPDDVPGDPDALDDGERESVDLVLGAMAA
jgi:hypothetical protein